MTITTIARRIAAPLLSSVATAGLLAMALWIQHGRSAWPFAAGQTQLPDGGPLAADIENAADRVPVDSAAARSLDIRLETVGLEPLTQTIRAVATIVPDESRISHVHTRVSGWIEHLHVRTTGEFVRAGQPLAHIFSQELLSSQTEYLAARRSASASGLATTVIDSGRERLRVFGMTADEIESIEETGQPKRLVTVVAPQSGVVVNRGITVGTSVDPSTTLITVADLSRVWILAEVPEASMSDVRVGVGATLEFPGSGRAEFPARVEFIHPTLTERTRTLRVRMSASNSNGALRPGLYGTAIFHSTRESVITVPRDAVVDTGLAQHVFVVAGDVFEPRRVALGAQLADRVEVRDGLRAGEQIVAAGVFLLDSESRLRATGGAGGHQHGAPSAGKQPAAPDPHAGHRD